VKANDFDKIASVYDLLARLVFGKSIKAAREHFLNRIPADGSVLILGGGSGEILLQLHRDKPNVDICYIDTSAAMMTLAKRRVHPANTLFIQGTEDDIPARQFNVVITHFYLDLFSVNDLNIAVSKIRKSMIPGAQWIVADFLDGRWWNRTILKIMYVFFRITCNIQTNALPDWSKALEESGGRKKETTLYYGGFIEAAVFQF
jgi:tRNA (cmo5U34)-methyltransferase